MIFTKGEKEKVDEDFLCVIGNFNAKLGSKTYFTQPQR